MLPIVTISTVWLHFRQFVPSENVPEITRGLELVRSGKETPTINFMESCMPHGWAEKRVQASLINEMLESRCEWRVCIRFLEEFLFLNPEIEDLRGYSLGGWNFVFIANDKNWNLSGIYWMPCDPLDMETMFQAIPGHIEITPLAYIDWISLDCTEIAKQKNTGELPKKTEWERKIFQPKNPHTRKFAYFMIFPMIALAGRFLEQINPWVIFIFLLPLWFIIPLFVRGTWALANIRTRYEFRKTEVIRRSFFRKKTYPFDVIERIICYGSTIYIQSSDESVLKSECHSIENYEWQVDIATEWTNWLMRSKLRSETGAKARNQRRKSILDLGKTSDQIGTTQFDKFFRVIFPWSISELSTFMSVHHWSERSVLTRKGVLQLRMTEKNDWVRSYPDFSTLAGTKLTYVWSMNSTSVFMSETGHAYTLICGRLRVHEWTFETAIDSVLWDITVRELPLAPTGINIYRHAWHTWSPMDYETGGYEWAKKSLSCLDDYSDGMTYPLFYRESMGDFIAYSTTTRKYLKFEQSAGESWDRPRIEILDESSILTAASPGYQSSSAFLDSQQVKKYISDCLNILWLSCPNVFIDMEQAFENNENTVRISSDSGKVFLAIETVNRDWTYIWTQHCDTFDKLITKAQMRASQYTTPSQEIARSNFQRFRYLHEPDYCHPSEKLSPIFQYIRDDSIEAKTDGYAQYSIVVPEIRIRHFMADITSILGMEVDFLYLQDMLINDGTPGISHLTVFKDELQRVSGFIAADLQRHKNATDYPVTIRCEKNMAQKIKGRLEEWNKAFRPSGSHPIANEIDKADTHLTHAMKKYHLTLQDILTNDSDKQRDSRYGWKQKLRRHIHNLIG